MTYRLLLGLGWPSHETMALVVVGCAGPSRHDLPPKSGRKAYARVTPRPSQPGRRVRFLLSA